MSSGAGETPLCERCQGIDFNRIFETKNWRPSREVGRVVSEHFTSFDDACGLCSLLLSLDPADLRSHNYPGFRQSGCHLKAYDCVTALSSWWLVTPGLDPRNSVVVAAVRGAPNRMTLLPESREDVIFKGVVVRAVPDERDKGADDEEYKLRAYLGRRVDQDRANFPLISSYIRECVRSHTECRLPLPPSSVPTHIIDCRNRKIVPRTGQMKYLALSYVWGPPRASDANSQLHAELSADRHPADTVPPQSPATIEDAIQVVLELGERYLWVDRYCILSHETKDLQIKNMGAIYGNALATIVALSGDNSDSGLPGVSRRRRPQASVKTKDYTLIATLPHVSLDASHSRWATRGWTYQELLLSRRCVFFTDSQFTFACRTSARSESALQSPGLTYGESLGLDLVFPDRFTERRTANSEFAAHIVHYTERSLSYPEDRLDAIRPVLAELETPSYWGVPFVPLRPKGRESFCRGLLWTVSRSASARGRIVTRHSMFPSWSWASVDGKIDFFDVHDLSTAMDWGEVKTARVEAEGTGRRPVPIECLLKSTRRQSPVIEEISPYLRIRGYTAAVRLRDYDREFNCYVVESPVRAPRRGGRRDVYVEAGRAHIDATPDEATQSRLARGAWDVLCVAFPRRCVLGRWDGGEMLCYGGILLEWEGETARRVGLVYMSVSRGVEWKIHLKKRTVRLG